MNNLSKSFSLLHVDAEDDKEQIVSLTVAKDKNHATKSDKDKKKGELSGKTTTPKLDKVNEGSLSLSSGDYRMPLVWIDLEMTGLNIEVDRILEIACVITDGKLAKSVEGPDLVIIQTKECLDNMGQWCRDHHAASGLTEKVLQSNITENDAETQVIDFVKKHVGSDTPLLAGNSVYVDFLFLKKYMPNLAAIFPHVLVDVSSIMALCIRWFPKEKRRAPAKEKKHRAMDDIKESIRELRYYKESIFKAPNKSK
ncbi:oligoribonuclease-like [Phoenix dactylifera]|uniref:Oligoribonuclease-like n=1 Tax=Phoenix dactylifera TaxID=42345 RepID=A0A8B9AMM5_PHODC|nr:oligoribonuclease-like [Phoenix dactylifera]XP_038984562.1 oligoribonuclease-like [Phoenix dactylifera]XP_038984564.1 oligoribonuclease-like [Phoenix dactylifera]